MGENQMIEINNKPKSGMMFLMFLRSLRRDMGAKKNVWGGKRTHFFEIRNAKSEFPLGRESLLAFQISLTDVEAESGVKNRFIIFINDPRVGSTFVFVLLPVTYPEVHCFKTKK